MEKRYHNLGMFMFEPIRGKSTPHDEGLILSGEICEASFTPLIGHISFDEYLMINQVHCENSSFHRFGVANNVRQDEMCRIFPHNGLDVLHDEGFFAVLS